MFSYLIIFSFILPWFNINGEIFSGMRIQEFFESLSISNYNFIGFLAYGIIFLTITNLILNFKNKGDEMINVICGGYILTYFLIIYLIFFMEGINFFDNVHFGIYSNSFLALGLIFTSNKKYILGTFAKGLVRILFFPSYIFSKIIHFYFRTFHKWLTKDKEDPESDLNDEEKIALKFLGVVIVLIFAEMFLRFSGLSWLEVANNNFNLKEFIIQRAENHFETSGGDARLMPEVQAHIFYQDFIGYYELLRVWLWSTLPFVAIYLFFEEKIMNKVFLKEKTDDMNRLVNEAKEIRREKALKEDKLYAGTIKDYQENKDFVEGLGLNAKNQDVFISDEQRSLNVQIIGSTGSGKTASQITPWAIQDMRKGRGMIIMDAKGDLSFYQKLKGYKEKYGLEQEIEFVNLGDPKNSASYNPLGTGDHLEVLGRIMACFDWSDSFYRSEAESSLLSILQAIEISNFRMNLINAYNFMSSQSQLEKLRDTIPREDEFGETIKWNEDILTDLDAILEDFSTHLRNCGGLLNNLKLMARGSFAQIGADPNPDVNLKEVYEKNKIVYFGLPVNSLEDIARIFGKMLLLDLKATANLVDQGKMGCDKKFFPVFIDEFAEFANSTFVGWLNKTRSSGMAIHIAHQSLSDLSVVDQHLKEQIIDNTLMKMVFRVNSHKTAQDIVDQLGTKEVKEKSRTISEDGKGGERKGTSIKKNEEYILDINTILATSKKGLRQGEAVIFGKHPEFFRAPIRTDYLPDLDDVDIKEEEVSKPLKIFTLPFKIVDRAHSVGSKLFGGVKKAVGVLINELKEESEDKEENIENDKNKKNKKEEKTKKKEKSKTDTTNANVETKKEKKLIYANAEKIISNSLEENFEDFFEETEEKINKALFEQRG